MIRRSLETRSYAMPVVGLAINVSWEIVYALYVAETAFERLGFTIWLRMCFVFVCWLLIADQDITMRTFTFDKPRLSLRLSPLSSLPHAKRIIP